MYLQGSAVQRALGSKNLAQIIPYLLWNIVHVLQFSEPRAL